MNPSQQLTQAVSDFCAFVEHQADENKAWGPKEVLSHLLFWHESFVTQSEAILNGQAPVPPDGTFDDLNVQSIETNRQMALNDLIQRFIRTNQRLGEIASLREPEQIVFRLKKGSSIERSLQWYMRSEANHIYSHLKILQQQAIRNPAHDANRTRAVVEEFGNWAASLPETTPQWEKLWQEIAEIVVRHSMYLTQIRACQIDETGVNTLKKPHYMNEVVQMELKSRSDSLRRFYNVNEQLCYFIEHLDPQKVLVEVRFGNAFHPVTLDNLGQRISSRLRQIMDHMTDSQA